MAARRARTPLLVQPAETVPPITVAFVGHRGVGKTDLVEAVLERARVVREAGTVAHGTTLLDCDAESRAHRQTLGLGVAWFEWSDPNRWIQVLDTPGASFAAHTRDLALHAADIAVVVVDAAAGAQHGTRAALAATARIGVPAVVVVAKADRWTGTAAVPAPPIVAEDLHGRAAAWLHLPFTDEHGRLTGVVDVFAKQVLRFADDRSGAFSPEPIPYEWQARADLAHEQLCEAVASTDDALLEQYLEYFTLEPDSLAAGLAAAVRANKLVPVVVASADYRIGVGQLIDIATTCAAPFAPRSGGAACAEGAPGEDPLVAQVLSVQVDEDGAEYHVLKVWSGQHSRGDWVDDTGRRHRPRKFYRVRGPRRAVAPDLRPGAIVATWELEGLPVGATLSVGGPVQVVVPPPLPPMATWQVAPQVAHQREAVERALFRLVHADRSLTLSPAPRGSEGWLLSGHDEDHLRIALERFGRWSGLVVTSRLPAIGFVEAPIASVADVEGVFLETDADGLPDAYGRCVLDLRPVEPEAGVTFEDELGADEGDLPGRFRPAVAQGTRLAAASGPTAGLPVTGVQFVLRGGAYDLLVTTEEHLQAAGERAAKLALERAGTRILEPWRLVEVRAPASTLGELIADLTAHRGRILGLHMDGPDVVLSAEAPYRELRTYGARMRSITSGRGFFVLSATRYEPAPDWVAREAEADVAGAARPAAHRRVAGR